MTFDELWRQHLERRRPLLQWAANAEDPNFPEDLHSTESATELPDEAEIDRYLAWLEESLRIEDTTT